MKSASKVLGILVILFVFFSFKGKDKLEYKSAALDIIPAPNTTKIAEGFFEINKNTALAFDESLENAAQFFNAFIKKGLGFELKHEKGKQKIVFSENKKLKIGAYKIKIDHLQILIESKDDKGAFYAVQSMRQLLPASFENSSYSRDRVSLPCLIIEDAPKFVYRGMMLDVSRHFFTVEEVKHLIDRIALYKINILHLHLSDDQGWRIEIKSWPNLTKKGSTSSVNNEKSGFYTQEDYKEIQEYALKHHITIVPEIDMPGHINAALASYPILNCDGKSPELYYGTEVGFSSLCVKKAITYEFVSDVIKEISSITTGPYFHIGGDETDATPKDEYISFINRVRGIVKENGKKVIGWDEIAATDLDEDALIHYWRRDENALLGAQKGAKVILSPAKRIYIDIKYNKNTKLGLTWAGLNDVKDAYDWDPENYVEGLEREKILGLEAPLWTETVVSIDDMEFMSFPRIIGVAELGWSESHKLDWDNYKVRLAKQKSRLERLGINYYKSELIDWQ